MRTLLLCVVASLLVLQPVGTEAATVTPLPVCPLEQAVSAALTSPNEVRSVSSVFSESIALANTSDFTMQGLTLAIAWYNADNIPVFLAVVADDVALAPKERTAIPVSVDVRAITEGSYTVVPFLVPGDEVAVLGHIQLGKSDPATAFIKSGEVVSSVSLEIAVNGEAVPDLDVSPGQQLTASVITTNLATAPLLNSKTVVALAQGTIALGEAVRIGVADSLKLFPGSRRTTSLFEPFSVSGLHTITVGVFTQNVAQPLITKSFQIGEGTETQSFSYLSALGIGAFVEAVGVPVVACVSETDSSVNRGGEVLEMTVDDYSQVVNQLPREAAGASFLLPKVSGEAALTLALLSPREQAVVTTREDADRLSGDGLVPVQTISFVPQCDRFDICVSTIVESASTFVQEPLFRTSVWFYLGIMLAALLLQLIILRRLPVKTPKKIEMTKPTK